MKKQSSQRLRASSLGPEFFNEEWYKVIKNPRFSRHLHISIQSGSNSVLKRMQRNYTAEQVAEIIDRLREISPDIAITTDIIVGFPGETETEFEETVKFVEENKLAKVHVFPYSERQNTLAAKMDQIPVPIRRKRAKKLQEAADTCRREFIKSQVGKKAEVLWEHSRSAGWQEGMTDNYIKVRIKGNKPLKSISPETLTKKSIIFD